MHERGLIEPVRVSFLGRDASEHRMDAVLLGQSLSGLARVYNSVGHFYFHGQVRTSQHSQVRVQVGPPKPGSILYLVYMLLVHGKMAVYPELLFSLAELAVPLLVKAIVAKKTGQTELLEKTLEMLERQSQRYHELVRATADNDMRIKERQLGVIERMALQNRSPMADMAAPVGKTIDEMRLISSTTDEIVIDAPTAESLRSPEELIVGQVQNFSGTIVALDTKTGAFKFEEAETGRELRGKITDPALAIPHNVYSHALDTKEPIALSAKPTLRENGEVHKLFVSDARR